MKIGFIGTGNMGGALAKAVAKSLPESELFFSDFDVNKAMAVADALSGKHSDNATICRECDQIFLGVKPQGLEAVLKEAAPILNQRENKAVLVSMAAGVSLAKILSVLGEGIPVIRIMPNTPVSVGKGVIVYDCRYTTEEQEERFACSLAMAGLVEKLEEKWIDAASALHGCGPAFVYLFIEALADGAVHCGLSRAAALRFAAATVSGAGEMVLQSKDHPGVLKDAVCSPGGTTIAGVRCLEESGFRAAAMDAVIAAYEKTLELGK